MTSKPSTLPLARLRKAAPSGRPNQKRRTRQALLDATLALSASGIAPTLESAAEKALVSRATAYRYFPSTEALMHEAYFERFAASTEPVVAQVEDPIERIGRTAESIIRSLLRDEVGLHVIERSFMQAWLDSAPTGVHPLRAEQRMNLIEQFLVTLSGQLTGASRARLRVALTMVIGVEAVLSMRDVAGASIDEVAQTASWAARALVTQALAEARSKRASKSSTQR